MKHIFFIFSFLFFFLFSSSVFAELEVFLDSGGQTPYKQDIWTSKNFPVIDSDTLKVQYQYNREEVPSMYLLSDVKLKNEIYNLFPSYSDDEKKLRYESLMDFSTQGFIDYIGVALSADTESNLQFKNDNAIILTPFESTFQACGIDLSERRTIAAQLIEQIYAGAFSDVDDIEYSNREFGDCIIPFPDKRRKSLIGKSFPSNQYKYNSKLDFGAKEQDVSLISLSGGVLTSTYANVQNANLLGINSLRVDPAGYELKKEHGKERIVFFHQNHYINPFSDDLVVYDGTSYKIAGVDFVSHESFTTKDDPEDERTFLNWTQLSNGLYKKTLLQEDTFEMIGGVYTPRQKVGATTYYAILYNYDSTPPVCSQNLFSHDITGAVRFVLPVDPWFGEKKYFSFVCDDIESGCMCDGGTPGCYTQSGFTLSIPQEVPHLEILSYNFINKAGLSYNCTTTPSEQLRYDFISPEVRSLVLDSGTREYVESSGILFDGIQTTTKRYYNIKELASYEADDTLNIEFELIDPSPSTGGQSRSGLTEYRLEVAYKEGLGWRKLGELSGALSVPVYTLSLRDLNDSIPAQNILTKTGEYQVTISAHDIAGNTLRVLWYYTITPGDIDSGNSNLEVALRENKLANASESYEYALQLRDRYHNPVPSKQASSIIQTCLGGGTTCKFLRSDMSGLSPTGLEALDIRLLAGGLSDSDGKIYFEVSSLAPGVFTERFQVNFSSPSETFIFTSAQDNRFLKPVTGTLETLDAGVWYDDRLFVGDEKEYRVFATVSGGITSPSFSLIGDIKGRHPDTTFALSGSVVNTVTGIAFRGTFTSFLAESEAHKTLLEIVENDKSGIIVSYTLTGVAVSYRLTESDKNDAILTLTDTRELENPVKIIGTLQGVGNKNNPNERQNISDIQANKNRDIFRKNIMKNIHGRSSNTTVNTIKYIDKTGESDKNYILEADPAFETLIVRNGNIVIAEDFNLAKKSIGLISYIDAGYDVRNGFSEVGNIYIEPDVHTIYAFIYADGAIVSSISGTPLSGTLDISRKDTLKDQLHIFGSIFTRNTLAGARGLAGEYTYPGGQKTTVQSEVVPYDLYYLRQGNTGCTKDIYAFCDVREYLILTQDSKIFTRPPTLFSQ